ncbi:Formyltransferase [Marasmius fiardii PR-910]|nr:Formyltransferase [Marasmius fiardii PR-910]
MLRLKANSNRRPIPSQLTSIPRLFSSRSSVNQFRILFMGRDEFSCLVMQELFTAKDVWQQIHIVTSPDERTNRGAVFAPSPLKLLGEKLNLPVHLIPQAKPDFKKWEPPHPFLDATSDDMPPLDRLLVTASFGRIIPSRILNLFHPDRRLNVHPSLLPHYRGPAPIQHAILNDERETGVCVIDMLKKSQGIDAGPIWASTRVVWHYWYPHPLESHCYTTFSSLRDELAIQGGRLLVSVLRAMIAGKAFRMPQIETEQLKHAPLITFTAGLIDFRTMTAESIVRRYRAISHQRPLTLNLPVMKTLQIHAPSIVNSPPHFVPNVAGRGCLSKPTNALLIRCAENTVLSVPLVKQEGKALVDAKAWWNGAESLGLVTDKHVNFTQQS